MFDAVHTLYSAEVLGTKSKARKLSNVTGCCREDVVLKGNSETDITLVPSAKKGMGFFHWVWIIKSNLILTRFVQQDNPL